MSDPLASIVINNFNYGRFLRSAIESALSQTYRATEVVVVDDGSTDDSREIILSYGGRIVPVLKENGGQGSAFNAGVSASSGEILCFLDADDLFDPGKVIRVVEFFGEHEVNSGPMMVHHFLAVKNDAGKELIEMPEFYRRTHESPMNRYAFARRHRALFYEAGPTSSLSINRALADRLFPIPEKGIRVSADDFLVYGASLLGQVYSLPETLGTYRVHGNNGYFYTGRRKSPEFSFVLQMYLNSKLVENGLSPVISFDDSFYVWDKLIEDHSWARLFCNMLEVCVRDHDRYTIIFAYSKSMEAGMEMMKTLRRKRKALLERFGRCRAAS